MPKPSSFWKLDPPRVGPDTPVARRGDRVVLPPTLGVALVLGAPCAGDRIRDTLTRSRHVRGHTGDGSRTLLHRLGILGGGFPGGPIETAKLDIIAPLPHAPR